MKQACPAAYDRNNCLDRTKALTGPLTTRRSTYGPYLRLVRFALFTWRALQARSDEKSKKHCLEHVGSWLIVLRFWRYEFLWQRNSTLDYYKMLSSSMSND